MRALVLAAVLVVLADQPSYSMPLPLPAMAAYGMCPSPGTDEGTIAASEAYGPAPGQGAETMPDSEFAQLQEIARQRAAEQRSRSPGPPVAPPATASTEMPQG